MTTIHRQIHIDASPDQVWAVLADLAAVQNYSPGVASAHYTSSHREGIGASRHCDLRPKGRVEERIVAWQEQQGYTIEIYEGIPALREVFGHFSLSPRREGTLTAFTMQYKMRFGPLGALINALMVKRHSRSRCPAFSPA
jgi:carbon monoxide dehydrogenase subunit G